MDDFIKRYQLKTTSKPYHKWLLFISTLNKKGGFLINPADSRQHDSNTDLFAEDDIDKDSKDFVWKNTQNAWSTHVKETPQPPQLLRRLAFESFDKVHIHQVTKDIQPDDMVLYRAWQFQALFCYHLSPRMLTLRGGAMSWNLFISTIFSIFTPCVSHMHAKTRRVIRIILKAYTQPGTIFRIFLSKLGCLPYTI